MFAKCATFKFTKWDNQQNVLITFHNFPVHKCISWDILSPGRKWDILSPWDNLPPKKCKLNNGFLIYMPEIWPKIAQDISQICPRYVQALPEVWGFKLRKWDKMSPGRVHKLGHYVAREVHNAVRHFVVGTKCLLTVVAFLPTSPKTRCKKIPCRHSTPSPRTGSRERFCL